MGGSKIVTDVTLGKRAFDAGVKTVTKTGQEIFAEILSGWWVSSVASREIFTGVDK